MRNRTICVLLGLSVLVFGGIALRAQQKSPPARPAADYSKQISDLKRDIEALAARVASLESEKSNLQFRLSLVESANQSVTLDLSSRQFQRLDANNGIFLISVQEATPYLSGYKISLDIGNPSSAKFNGFKLKAKWGQKYDYSKYTAASWDQWNKGLREKEISFVEQLRPGAWNHVTLILPDTTSEQLGYLLVSLETDNVVLSQ